MDMSNIALVISSCWKYSDLWDMNISLLNTNWPSRNMRTLLVTDRADERKYENIEIYISETDGEMPQRMLSCLNTINTEYILYCQDDYFFTKPIPEQLILQTIKMMDTEELDYVRLYPYPHSNKKIKGYPNFRWITFKCTYDVNLYPGIWRRKFLCNAMKQTVDIWKLETSLTKFAQNNGMKCAMLNKNLFPFLDVISKGKLHYNAFKYFKRNHICSDRGHLSFFQELFHQVTFHIRSILPKPLFIIIKRGLMRIGVHFYSDGY